MQTIRNDLLTIQINERGAELHSIRDMEGTEYLWQGDAKYWDGQAPNLFPYVGRFTKGEYTLNGQTYQMDIHGFAKDMIYEVEEISDNQVMFCLESNEITRIQYPYEFRFYVVFSLKGNRLSILYRVENQSTEKMYFGLGGHPGFCVPLEAGLAFEDYYLEFEKETQAKRVGFSDDCFVNGVDKTFALEDGTKLLLKHNLFDDDAIVLKDMARGVTLRSDKGRKAVRVMYPDMPYLGLWHWPKTDAPYVCIEPWLSLPSRKDIVEDFATHPSMCSLAAGKTYLNQINIIFDV